MFLRWYILLYLFDSNSINKLSKLPGFVVGYVVVDVDVDDVGSIVDATCMIRTSKQTFVEQPPILLPKLFEQLAWEFVPQTK